MLTRLAQPVPHWRPPHDPYTFTADGEHPERLTKIDRRHMKRRFRRMLDQMDDRDDVPS